MRLSPLLVLLVPAQCFQSLSRSSSTWSQPRTATTNGVAPPVRLRNGGHLQPLKSTSSANDSAAAAAAASSLSGGADQDAAAAALRTDLLKRSTVAGLSCVTTWALATTTALPVSLSIIQASCIQGLLGCAAFASIPAYAAASFCGSFAGMSAQVATVGEASLLGAACAAVYYWFERPSGKLQVGKGGRLGTIAFLANVLYLGVRQGGRGITGAAVDVVNLLRPSTALAVLAASLVTAATKKKGGDNNEMFVKVSSVVAKTALLSALVARYLATASASGGTALSVVTQKLLPSTAAMFAASLVVKKSPGVVLPVAITGLVGSFLGSLAAPIYLGAFIGMTGLQAFGVNQFFESSILSTLLLQLGLFNGFGGKLGFLSFLGVNFAM